MKDTQDINNTFKFSKFGQSRADSERRMLLTEFVHDDYTALASAYVYITEAQELLDTLKTGSETEIISYQTELSEVRDSVFDQMSAMHTAATNCGIFLDDPWMEIDDIKDTIL